MATLKGQCDCLIVDLANPPREDLPHFNILRSISDALNEVWWPEARGLVIVLLPKPLSPNDGALRVLQAHLSANDLVLIDPQGRVYGNLPSGQPRIDRYEEALLLVREDPIALIRRKMIRRIGYFRRPSQNARATKYFYDCTHCTENILEALIGRIEFDAYSQIFVHAPVSDWMETLADSISVEYGLERIALEDLISDPSKLLLQPLVLLPLVDTGETVHMLASAIRERSPEADPRFVSILATGGEMTALNQEGPTGVTPQMQKRLLTKGGESELVEYLLGVDQEYYSETYLPMSLDDHQGSVSDLGADPINLTSYAFWTMMEESGWRHEKNFSSIRTSLGEVPNIPEVLRRNGPLIAHKLHRLLSEGRPGLPVDPLFVCPEEDGAGEVAESIISMFGYSVVQIARDDFERQIDQSHAAEAFRDCHWWSQLVSAAGSRARVILMDEFRMGGTTLGNLMRVCRLAGLTVERCVVFADFGRSQDYVGGLPVEALYRVPLGG